MQSGKHIIALGVLLVLVLGAMLYLTQMRGAEAPEVEALPVLGSAPIFQFTDARGLPFHSAELEGAFWVADFFFTSCRGPCPILSSNMAELQEAFEGQNVRLVSITVDPETDTPERLAQYGEQYGADFDRWHFLTGAMEDIHAAANGFMVAAHENPDLHTTRFILVDREGQIRGFYHGVEDESVAELHEALAQLVAGAA